MAAVEPLGSADPLDATQWLVVRGTLREVDLPSLLEEAGGPGLGDVTLDLVNLDRLTPGGCWTIRNLADELWSQGRRLTVVFSVDAPIVDVLRATGTFDDHRMRFQGSIE